MAAAVLYETTRSRSLHRVDDYRMSIGIKRVLKHMRMKFAFFLMHTKQQV